MTAARNLYLAQDVTFKPRRGRIWMPPKFGRQAGQHHCGERKAAAIIDAATNLISIFESTQV